jgi:hypothetical protein
MVRYKKAMQPTNIDACLPHLRLELCRLGVTSSELSQKKSEADLLEAVT